MSIKHLGETFDIHGGGMDLIFPHHENEIAQSCGATGKEFARYWIHNGFVQINHEKMSKSLGNFFTIREIFEKSEWSEEVTGEVLRYFLLSTQYRGPLDFSDLALKEAKQALNGFYDLFMRLDETGRDAVSDNATLLARLEESKRKFAAAMDNDLNTPLALATLQMLRNDVNKMLAAGLSTRDRQRTKGMFRSLGAVMRLFQLHRWEFNVEPGTGSLVMTGWTPTGKVEDRLSDEQIEAKVAERLEARRRKDFRRADEIREELHARGVTLEDRPDGTSRWKR
jgi:cysteinyl-tRNA synthetase